MTAFYRIPPALASNEHQVMKWREAAAYMDAVWRIAEPYLDQHRAESMPREGEHALFWEAYLAAALLDRGHVLTPRTKKRIRNAGPDIQIGDVDAWVEAVTATRGTGPDAVPEVDLDPRSPAREVPDRKILLRITYAIDDKWKTYCDYVRKGWVRSDEPFVIAINGAAAPTARLESTVPRIVRAVLGIGQLVVTFDVETLRAVDEHHAAMPQVRKRNGSAIETVHFRDARYSGISAVVWGTADVWNRPDYFGRDLVVVHNPYAANPLPRGWFREGVEFWTDNDETELRWRQWWKERDADLACVRGM
jgi:hypothetical protein